MNAFCHQVSSILRACSLPFAIATAAFVAQPAAAAIIGTTGDVVIAPKPQVSADYPDGSFLYVFEEAESIEFPSGLNPDIGSIPTGRVVDSYLFHFDPNPNVETFVAGTVEFSRPILGFITERRRLNRSDALFEAVAPLGRQRGLESDDISNSVLAVQQAKIELALRASNRGIDQVRVFVAAPEPTSVVGALLLGGVGLGSVLKRRQPLTENDSE